MKRRWKKFRRGLGFVLVCAVLLVVLQNSWPVQEGEDYEIAALVQNRRFDFIGWELEALGEKALYALDAPHSYLTAEQQKAAVLNFFEQLGVVQGLERDIARLYADPAVTTPDAATAGLQEQLAAARAELERRQPLAEGILQEQIATVLQDMGLATFGRTFPPVELHFTPLPSMLVISPRDHIEAVRFVTLEHGLETPERAELEGEVDAALDVSSLVTDIGGLAAYPAMMLESTSFNWVVETGAHEWTHHYLTLHPLGALYDSDAQMRTINETVASVVGGEVGAEVVRRYYPELVPPPAVPAAEFTPEPDPDAFDYRAEMRETRVRADELLAEGKIGEAEAYMEARRQFMWEHGYQIRKLNQAYFAFYGAYADEPGEQGEDPVGPAVLELRARSGSLEEFLQSVAWVTSFEDLEGLLAGS